MGFAARVTVRSLSRSRRDTGDRRSCVHLPENTFGLLKLPSAVLSRAFAFLSMCDNYRLCVVSRYFQKVAQLPTSSPYSVYWRASDKLRPPPSFRRLRPAKLEWHERIGFSAGTASWYATIEVMGCALRSLTFTDLRGTFTDWTPLTVHLSNLTTLDYKSPNAISVAPLARFMPRLSTLSVHYVTFSELLLFDNRLTHLDVRRSEDLMFTSLAAIEAASSSAKDDIISSSAKDDIISSSTKNDIIFSLAKNDVISSSAKCDIISEPNWHVLLQLSKLRHLQLGRTHLPYTRVLQLCRSAPVLTTLECISLAGCTTAIDPDALLCDLRRLECPGLDLSPIAFAEICMFPRLEILMLKTYRTLEPRHFDIATPLRRLWKCTLELKVASPRALEELSKWLAGSPRLRELDVAWKDTVNIVSLQPLSVLTALRSFTLRHCCGMIDFALPPLPFLETLELRDSRRSGTYLTALSRLYPCLTKLSLPLFRGTSLLLDALGSITHLRSLDIQHQPPTWFTPQHLSQLHSITHSLSDLHTLRLRHPSENSADQFRHSSKRGSVQVTAEQLYTLFADRKRLYLDLS
jgi:hypothetical protein